MRSCFCSSLSKCAFSRKDDVRCVVVCLLMIFTFLILHSPFDTGDRCFIGGKSLDPLSPFETVNSASQRRI